MPDFMIMVLANEAEEAHLAPSDTKALLEGHAAYERKLRAASAYVDGERLRPSTEGRRVRVRDNEATVQAGPFGETPLGGYYIVRAPTLEAATELAKECPMAPGTALDVRPLMKGHLKPEKAGYKGRVFAFAVLGNEPNEPAWIDVMDRIDAGSDKFPSERSLGGVRLEAPGRGRRVTSAGGQRAIFDGPFLESKEVIGGVFFMRMTTLDEAVHWAKETRFVKLGTAEIRELWRS